MMPTRRMGVWVWLAVVSTALLAPIGNSRADENAELRTLVKSIAERVEGACVEIDDLSPCPAGLKVTYLLQTDPFSMFYDNAMAAVADVDGDTLAAELGCSVCWSSHPLERQNSPLVAATPSGDRTDAIVLIGKGIAKDWAQLDPTRIAIVIGHELGHIVLGHVFGSEAVLEEGPELLSAMLYRDNEFDADAAGVRYAAAAGYNDAPDALASMWERVLKITGDPDAQLEPLSILDDHPPVRLRIEEAQRDPQRKAFWRATNVFREGVAFLKIGAWDAAESCFLEARRLYPDAGEVLSNLAHTKMMRYYCDMSGEDRSKVGGAVSCLTYVRDWMPPRGGGARELLEEAIALYRRALELAPGLIPARANLAAAFIMDPDASPAQLDDAIALLDSVLQEANPDPFLFADAVSNKALALARKFPSEAASHVAKAQQALAQRLGDENDALLWANLNAGLKLAGSEATDDRASAYQMLSFYVTRADEYTPWVKVAQQRLERLRTTTPSLANAAVPEPRHAGWWAPYSLRTQNSEVLRLGMKWENGAETLFTDTQRIAPDDEATSLRVYEAEGLRIHTLRDYVRVVVVTQSAGHALELKRKGSRESTEGDLTLRIGDNIAQKIPTWAQVDTMPIWIDGDQYLYNASIGLAVRTAGGSIEAMAIFGT
ncbi:MAG: M48 family metalloprotease [Dehalococcoidia bacterium]|nr:M48 family metalloprotease [Dehalococcoidia bacterium]